MKNWHWFGILLVAVGASFLHGEDRGARRMLETVIAQEAKRAEVAADCQKWQEVIARSECRRADEDQQRLRQDIVRLERERDVLEAALRELSRGVDFEPSLKIQWNKKRLQPWTEALIFNADAMPAGRFTDKQGFVLAHHAKRADRAVFLGESGGRVVVLCLSGPFKGRVLNFQPWERYDQQRVLVYHF